GPARPAGHAGRRGRRLPVPVVAGRRLRERRGPGRARREPKAVVPRQAVARRTLARMSPGELIFLAVARFGARLADGGAGGGSMVSFPALLAVGVPSLAANVTSTVGIWPGYLGGAAGFRDRLAAQRDRLRELAPISLAGALVGSGLLLITSEDAFDHLA